MKKHAFTLVELLAVIGIISLLMGLLLPSLTRARESAQRVHCAAVMKAIGSAALMHAQDHRNHLPPAGWHFRLDGKPLSPETLGDADAKNGSYYREDGIDRPLPITAALGRYLISGSNVSDRPSLEALLKRPDFIRLFHCEAHEMAQTGISQKCDTTGWTSPPETSSYVFNEAILGRRPMDPDRVISPTGNLSKLRNPARLMLAADGRPRNMTNDNFILVFNNSATDSLYDFQQLTLGNNAFGKETFDFKRHRGWMNVLFADFHVEPMLMTPETLKSLGLLEGK